MANLSNINNKFIVTDGGNVLIGQTNNSSGILQIKDTQTSSFNDGLAITRNNAAQTGYINMVGGAFNFNSPGLSYKFRNNGTQTLELDSSGNVGIGITPNVNSNVVNVIQLGKGMTLLGNVNDDRATMAANLYLDTGTAFRYVMDGLAGRFSIEDGNMVWGTASSGTAGTVATVETKMTLLNNGKLGIGGGAIEGKLSIDYTAAELPTSGTTSNSAIQVTSSLGNQLNLGLNTVSGDYGAYIQASDNNLAVPYPLNLQPNGGNVGIGTTSPTSPTGVARFLHISGSPTAGIVISDSDNADYNWDIWNSGGGLFMKYNDTTFGVCQLSNGNVGIGTTSPQEKLHIVGLDGSVPLSSYYGSLVIDNNGEAAMSIIGNSYSSIYFGDADTNFVGAINYQHSVNAMIFKTENNTEKMRITSGGNVNISTSSGSLAQTSYKLRVESDPTVTNGIYLSAGTSSSNHALYVENKFSSSEHFAVRGDGQIRLNASRVGNIIFGGVSLSGVTTGSPTGSAFGMESNGRSVLFQGTTSTATMTMQAFYNPNGQVGTIKTSGSSTSFNTSSDYRLKEDLQDFNGLDKISKIPVYDFKWKVDESRSYGVLAHELQEVIPDAVAGEKDAVNEDESISPQGVDYSKIVPILVKSIQELKAEIDELKK